MSWKQQLHEQRKLFVAFEWNSLGTAPTTDQFEVSTFGPGYGECCVLHVGEGRWVIVDSCVDSTDHADRRPVAERYLRALGVDIANQVDIVVATHWHSDHVRGIGRLVEQASSAKFCCASALLHEQFLTYVEQLATGAAATEGAKVNDFRTAIHAAHGRGTGVQFALGNRTLKVWGQEVVLRSLSPSDTEFGIFLQNIASQLPKHGQPKRSAPSQDQNLCAIVLQLQTPHFGVLLGADMEVHHDAGRGWNAIVSEAKNAALPTSALWKVPHHGSINGHHDDAVSHMLNPKPISVVTPFNRLPQARKLPTEQDRQRISAYSSALYATADASRQQLKGMEASVVRGIRESNIEIRKAGSDLGLVRCRWTQASQWTTELFGAAHKVMI